MKNKPKELDWDTLGIKEIFSQWLFFNGKLTGKEAEELWNKLSLMFKATLTQQRTELLEEIKDIEIGEADGWELARKFNCCPGDDMADAYNQALKDVIKLLKKL